VQSPWGTQRLPAAIIFPRKFSPFSRNFIMETNDLIKLIGVILFVLIALVRMWGKSEKRANLSRSSFWNVVMFWGVLRWALTRRIHGD